VDGMRTKRAWLAAMLSLLVLPGAASTPSYDPRDLGPPEQALVDCTEEVSAQMSWPTPVIPPAVRRMRRLGCRPRLSDATPSKLERWRRT
jgi:hypothetical protein